MQAKVCFRRTDSVLTKGPFFKLSYYLSWISEPLAGTLQTILEKSPRGVSRRNLPHSFLVQGSNCPSSCHYYYYSGLSEVQNQLKGMITSHKWKPSKHDEN